MANVTITTPADLNAAIVAGNAGPETGTFTTGFTELAPPTPITAAAGNLVLDGASSAYTLTGDGVDAALVVATGGNVTLESLNIANTAGAAAISIGAGGLATFEVGTTAADGAASTIGVISAPITGAGSISIVNAIGDGTQAPLVLTAANSYTGSTTIAAGTALDLGANGSIGGSTSVVDNGAFDASGAQSATGGAATIVLNNLSGSGRVNIGHNTLQITETSAMTFSGVIADEAGTAATGGIVGVETGGSLTLTGASTYTGATRIYGDVILGEGGSIADSANVSLKVSGAIFDTTATTSTTSIHELTGVAGTSVVIGNNGLTVSEDLTDASFSGVLSGATTVIPDPLLLEGKITLADSFSLEGTHTLTLTQVETYTGSTVIYTGAHLALSGAGSIAASTNVEVEGSLDLTGVSGGTVAVNNLSGLFGGGSIVLGANTLVDSTTPYYSFGGVISGAGGLTVRSTGGLAPNGANPGGLSLDGANTYTGATKIYSELDVRGPVGESNGSIAASSGVSLKTAGAKLYFEYAATQQITQANGDTDNAYVINTLSGVAGTFVETDYDNLAIYQNTTATFSGVIESDGWGIDVLGTATLTLAGVETYTGATVVYGSLALGAPAGSTIEGSIAASASVTINGSFYVASTTSVHDLSGTGWIYIASGALTDVMAATDAPLTLSGTISGAGGLTVAGAATTSATSLLNLSHANTYTGGTTLTGGTLELSAAGAVTGTITFADSNTTTNTAVLQIDNAALTGTGTATESFANTIAGLSTTDVIDLSGLNYSSTPGASSVSFSGGHLVVTEGNVSVALTITGVTSAAGFSVYEDSHGGTFIVHDSSTTGYSPTHYHP